MHFSLTTLSTLIVVSLAQDQQQYIPATSEQHVIETRNNDSNSGCQIWNTPSKLRDDLRLWRRELGTYTDAINLKKEFAPDVRRLFNEDLSNKEEVCWQYADPQRFFVASRAGAGSLSDPKTVEVKQSLRGRGLTSSEPGPTLMEEYFNGSQQLSYLPKYGYMEPLVPPLRHPDMCIPGNPPGFYMATMDFMIEDFGHICRHQLQKNTRNVFLDLGATYNFNSDVIDSNSPAIRAIEKYRRNGIHFDHIYAYEIRQWDTEVVYKTIPTHMQGPLHWLNTGITGEENHQHNPWTMLAKNFGPDDFVVVKLDIDTVSVEWPLFQQLLNTPQIQELVDIFYFEHHVKMDEMQTFWGSHSSGSTKGTIAESLELFQALRKAGVAAHYWI